MAMGQSEARKLSEERFGYATRGKVRLDFVEDFLAELGKDRELIDRDLVRIMYLTRTEGTLPFRQLFVVATCRVGLDILRLEYRAGEIFGPEHPESSTVVEHAGDTLKKLRTECERLGLEVRSGLLEA
jgi:hypothetical protein